MKISRKESKKRSSKIYSLFFVKNFKQKEIAEKLEISLSTVKRYIKKYKNDLT